MLARAAERRRPAVRGNAKFGRTGTTGVSPVAHDSPGTTGVSPVAHDNTGTTGVSPVARWFSALIALGVLALAGIVAYTLFILRSMPKERVSLADRPVQEVPPPPPPAQPQTELKFCPASDLADGWQVAFEVPDEQKVVIEYNEKKNAQVFRIEHAAPHVVRFTKHLSLRPRPRRLYWRVELADGRRGGAVTNFQFSTHLVISDEKGALLEKVDGGGKRSAKKDCAVPESATDAVLAIDCFCTGTHDLVVPHFAGDVTRW